MRKISFLFMLTPLLFLSASALGQQRCMLQITFDTQKATIIQLCSGTINDPHVMPLPMISPYNVNGPSSPFLPIPDKKVKIQTTGCSASITKDKITVTPSMDQYQVQISYSFDHKGKNYFVLVKNPTPTTLPYQVVTRRTTIYTPIVRPLALYTFEEEEDTQGAWQYMTLTNPLKPDEQLIIFAGNPADRGFLGNWTMLGAFLLLGLLLGAWRYNLG